jgi:hypothetical protein
VSKTRYNHAALVCSARLAELPLGSARSMMADDMLDLRLLTLAEEVAVPDTADMRS